MLIFPFLPPEVQRLIRHEQELEKKNLVSEIQSLPVQKWTDSIKWAPKLHVDAESYKGFSSPMFDVPPSDVRSEANAIRHGDWGYQNVILPKGEPMSTFLGARKGDVVFNGDVIIPKIWRSASHNVWMSLTPMEMLSQRPGFARAKGHVLVGGLGMGWALRKIAALKNVTRVTVAESSIDLLDWFGVELVRKISAESGKDIYIVGEAYANANEHFDKFDSFIFDIWRGYGAARDDYSWQKLSGRAKKAGKSAWAWGGAGAPSSRGEW